MRVSSDKNRLSWSNAEAQEVLSRYENVVTAMARRLAPVARIGQALDVEDLCAEGRIAVLEALRTYEGFGIEEKTWVRTRVRQRMIDAIRRLDVRTRDEVKCARQQSLLPLSADQADTDFQLKRRSLIPRRLVSFDSAPPEHEPLAARLFDAQSPTADEVADHNAQHERLHDALQVLPARQRAAIELALFEGYSLREIGDRMGISESRVCQLQKRAVKHLKRAVSLPPRFDADAA
jgi:RNA polymerase sigma factor for flagellar operon FliA